MTTPSSVSHQSTDQSIADLPAISRWAPVAFDNPPRLPVIAAEQARPILPGIDLWDCWPIARRDGRTATLGGRHWWFFLSAPALPDPADRHLLARIRLLSRGDDGWRDHGPALPDGLNPGACEWAGSALVEDDDQRVTLFYTVSGRRGGPVSFEQRLFSVEARFTGAGLADWQPPREIVAADGHRYVLDRQEVARPEPGSIKAFRDPAWFHDPATGLDHVLFTGSAAWSADRHNGVIGIATASPQGWVLGNPVIEAIGINNELERPCPLWRDGRYYLFWSTQAHTFSPHAVAGPNGLYGAVADSILGPWRPVNGNGLVAANPADEPTQSYSWWVTGEDEVWSFVDYWGMGGERLADHPERVRSHFGGTPAPVFRLGFDGDRVSVIA